MKDYQARGYVFESVIWRLLNKFGYINVKTSELRGRGASHQIDAYGELAIPTAFMYPVRLVCECKCFSDIYPVKLEHVRSFVGVIKDISENYIIDPSGNKSTPHRYTDVGCFFSASPFTKDAQEYAWAQNIFLISFNGISLLHPIIKGIKDFVKTYTARELKELTKSSIIEEFELRQNTSERSDIRYERDTSIAIGIIDGIYPAALVGKGNWLQKIDSGHEIYAETIFGVKTQRISNVFDTIFNLVINGENIQFSIPNTIARKLVERIDKSDFGDIVFEIDVPYIKKINQNSVRRFLKIMISLPDDEKNLFIDNLMSDNTN